MRPFFSLLFLACCVLPPAAAARAPDPTDTARAFYAWVLKHPSVGLPSTLERRTLAPLLSPRLAALLDDASATQARCDRAAAQGDKPLLIEGDLFVDNDEGATAVEIGASRHLGDRASVRAHLSHADLRLPASDKSLLVTWSDRLELRRIGGQWRVHDVSFSRHDSLTGVLKAYLAEGARVCPRG